METYQRDLYQNQKNRVVSTRGKLPFHIGLHRVFFFLAGSFQHTGEVAILQHPSVCVSSPPYLWVWARTPYVGNLFQPILFFCSLPRLCCHRWGLGCWKHLSAQCFLYHNSSVQCPHYYWLKTNFLSNFCSTFQMFMTKILKVPCLEQGKHFPS